MNMSTAENPVTAESVDNRLPAQRGGSLLLARRKKGVEI
jgi:hypothetical protein